MDKPTYKKKRMRIYNGMSWMRATCKLGIIVRKGENIQFKITYARPCSV
jgi:hypothetical protein